MICAIFHNETNGKDRLNFWRELLWKFSSLEKRRKQTKWSRRFNSCKQGMFLCIFSRIQCLCQFLFPFMQVISHAAQWKLKNETFYLIRVSLIVKCEFDGAQRTIDLRILKYRIDIRFSSEIRKPIVVLELLVVFCSF